MQPTASLLKRAVGSIRRLPLTTKMTNTGYYKGTGTGSMGRHTKHGGYVIEWNKVRSYVCPDLTGFELTPFVTKRMTKTRGRFAPGEHPIMGQYYLNKWKAENGMS